MSVQNIKKAYCYCRVSQKGQSTANGGFGMTRQQNLLLSYVQEYEAKEKDKPKDKTKDDLSYDLSIDHMEYLNAEGVSGFSGKNIDKGSVLFNFIEQCISGAISNAVLIVENLDRFSRANPQRAARILMDLLWADCHIHETELDIIHTKNSKLIDIATGLERSHKESLRKQKLSTKNWDKRFQNVVTDQKALTAKCPAWLHVESGKYQVNEYHAEQIRLIFELYNSGYGQAFIRDTLNDKGYLYNSNTWGSWLVHRILNDRRVTGSHVTQSSLRGEYDGLKMYPVIISDTDFSAVQQRLKSPGRDKKINRNANNLFAGLTVCSYCNTAHLSVMTDSKNNQRYFYCTNKTAGNGRCNTRGFKYDIVENAVLQYIRNIEFEIVDDKNINAELHALKTDLITKMQYRDEVLADINKVDIPDPIDRRAYKALQATIINLETQIKNLESLDDVSTEVKAIGNAISPELLDRKNVAMRQDFNARLRRVVKEIGVFRNENTLLIRIEYFSKINMQMIIVDAKTGRVILQSISDEGGLIIDTISGNRERHNDGKWVKIE
ncbi:recombinase-like zinc beta ribbon protein [Buttiauxella sp. BIGb0552]|uniref:recombinase family protein n=1 Tax=Buttiauxella sp. BIGb0552 TaxID=2485120 RepID=UPI001066E0EA|nr:recombinase family protein [Buttiauxella sp. BIGb0552]TDX13033.1 recombinase-like zinc beta ribbon protein [Buttiauxella sp. BIGb0552]